MPTRSGSEYIEKIDNLHSSIWIDGQKVNGKISEHQAFKGVIKSQAVLYDLQLKESNRDIMTFRSPVTGNLVGTSFLEPKTKEDLEKRRLMTQVWAKSSGGFLSRSPDYMNTVMMSFASAAAIFSEQDERFTKNMLTIFENAREQDLSFTHTFINPQVNRSSYYVENFTQTISAQTTEIKDDGIVINGARLLATQGGITDEILVFPANTAGHNKDLAYGFSIPSNTPGLKFICREPFSYRDSAFDHPLGSRFDEVDSIVVFDQVLVPWDRVLFYENPLIAQKIYQESSFHLLAAHQVTCRRIVKLEMVLGIAQKLIDSIQVGEYQHIHEKISEIFVGLESLKALLLASEVNAKADKWGTMVPDANPLQPSILLFARLYPRCTEILQLIGASGLMAIPTEADFSSEIGADLDLYLQGAIVGAEEKVKIFRLAWDISMSAFGSRQSLYERFFFGDAVRLASGLYMSYPKEKYVKLIDQFLDEY